MDFYYEPGQTSVYVASSWRNEFQQDVVTRLRQERFNVYDFKGQGSGWNLPKESGPGGFGWGEIDPGWKEWAKDVPAYLKALKHPRAKQGFLRDMDALNESDICLMVHPCGSSASMELGWAVGAKRKTIVYMPEMREPELMLLMADLITNKFDEALEFMKESTRTAKILVG